MDKRCCGAKFAEMLIAVSRPGRLGRSGPFSRSTVSTEICRPDFLVHPRCGGDHGSHHPTQTQPELGRQSGVCKVAPWTTTGREVQCQYASPDLRRLNLGRRFVGRATIWKSKPRPKETLTGVPLGQPLMSSGTTWEGGRQNDSTHQPAASSVMVNHDFECWVNRAPATVSAETAAGALACQGSSSVPRASTSICGPAELQSFHEIRARER